MFLPIHIAEFRNDLHYLDTTKQAGYELQDTDVLLLFN